MNKEEAKFELQILERKRTNAIQKIESYRRQPFISTDVMFQLAKDAVDAEKAAFAAREKFDEDSTLR